MEKEREILIDEIEKLLKTARIGKIRCAYILLLKKCYSAQEEGESLRFALFFHFLRNAIK